MSEDVKVALIIVFGIILFSMVIAVGCNYQRHIMTSNGYCESVLTGRSDTAWVKCK